MSNKSTEPNNLNTALATWCQRHGVKTADLASATGYTYVYAWRLLAGRVPVTAETLGRFVLAYGTEAASQVLALANHPTETLPAPHGAQTVSVVSVSSGPLGA